MNLTSFPRLASAFVCAAALLFTPAAEAARPKPKREKVVGTVKIEKGTTVLVNKVPQSDGSEIKCGDLIDTDATESVVVTLSNGEKYIIDPASRIRLTCNGNGPVQFLVVFGGVHRESDTSGLDPLPFFSAFGSGNQAFPAFGGGGSNGTGRVAVKNAAGQVVGFVITDSRGNVVAFTDPTGRIVTLASNAPNGSSISGFFGPGATL